MVSASVIFEQKAKSMTTLNLDKVLFDVAKECADRGPGFSQESVVLREVQKKLSISDIEDQQRVLDAWHRLFHSGKLVWGYDLSNPSSPFFHVAIDR